MRTPSFLLAALLALPGCTGPGLLDFSDSLSSGDASVRRVVRSAAFGPDRRQSLEVWAPLDASPAKPRPVLVFFYGGAWVEGARRDYAFVAKAYANQGFVVVLPDYRLAPEHGYPAFVQDGAGALRWTRDNIAKFGGDPARVAVAGHSAGAYITAMLALDPRFLAAEGVGPGFVKAAATLAGPFDFYPFTAPMARVAFDYSGAGPESQPINLASRDDPPMWIATGTADTLVKPYQSRRLAGAMRAAGAPHELKLYEGADHDDLVLGISKTYRGRTTVLADSVRFLSERLGLRAGGAPPTSASR